MIARYEENVNGSEIELFAQTYKMIEGFIVTMNIKLALCCLYGYSYISFHYIHAP